MIRPVAAASAAAKRESPLRALTGAASAPASSLPNRGGLWYLAGGPRDPVWGIVQW